MAYREISLEYTHFDKIAVIILRRPQAHNALNMQLINELTTVFTELRTDERLHGVILAGDGESFCAGADIKMMRDAAKLSEEENVQEAYRIADMLANINTFPCPVLARINGAALGGGVGLVAACDIAIAVEKARFALSEVKLGIAPAVISPYVVEKIGISNARVLFVTGERFSARRALDIGLVHSVVPAEQLDDAVQNAVSELLSSAPQALRACKQLAMNVNKMSATEARQYTAKLIAHLRSSDEGQEGLGAFLEKRDPAWRKK